MAIPLCYLPQLKAFRLPDVRLTGKVIGSGAYSRVEEGEIPGAVCAVKKFHGTLQNCSEMSENKTRRDVASFVEKINLLSSLRHPHIVQFFGICAVPDSLLPALVMERLQTNLHDLLETRNIPLALKHAFLCNIAKGISYLHSRSPPLVHHGLSARNVLLNTAMEAKIGDSGVTHIVRSQRVPAMTIAPNPSIYMPPEATNKDSLCDTSVDIFSLGVVAIYVLTQCFPQNVLAQVYQDQNQEVLRTELERRREYMQQIYHQFGGDHPLVQIITRCLESLPNKRPKIKHVLQLLEQSRTLANDASCHMDKLELVHTVKQLSSTLSSKNEEIELKNREIGALRQEMHSREEKHLQEEDMKKAEILQMKYDIELLDKESRKLVHELTEKIQSQQAEIEELRNQALVSHSTHLSIR